MNKLIPCLVLLLAAAACGDEEETASDKCYRFVDTLCDRGVECIGGGTHSECVQGVTLEINCDRASSVGSTFETCVSTLSSGSCSTLFPNDELVLPASCQSVIILE